MSLMVYPIDVDGNEIIPPKKALENTNQLFGPESWRFRVWGTAVLKKLNCKLITRLSREDLFIYGQELSILEGECELILNNLEAISQQLNIYKDQIAFRINNTLAAIKIAQTIQDAGVFIG